MDGATVTNILKSLRISVERRTGLRIIRRRPRGLELAADVRQFLPNHKIITVFDVGANVGQSALLYAQDWKSADIYSFEPSAGLFATLIQNTKIEGRIHPRNLALGSSPGSAGFVVDDVLSHLVRGQEDLSGKDVERVEVTTISEFCASEAIKHINFLKIDTEGFDLEVLKGAENMLRDNSIDLVQVEAGMSPLNMTHASLESMKSHLEERNYYLFGIYDQVHEWSGEPVTRRCNPVFISSQMWKTNRWN